MKKLFLSILLVSLVATVSAQDYTKKEVRDQKRTERQQMMQQQLSAALKAHNFTFAASYMLPEFNSPQVPLNQWNNYVALYPNFLEISLPYQSVAEDLTTVPKRIDISTTRYTYWEDMNNNGVWTYVFQTEWGNVKYVFHLQYNSNNGMATLTLVPNMGNTVTYTGTIQLN